MCKLGAARSAGIFAVGHMATSQRLDRLEVGQSLRGLWVQRTKQDMPNRQVHRSNPDGLRVNARLAETWTGPG